MLIDMCRYEYLGLGDMLQLAEPHVGWSHNMRYCGFICDGACSPVLSLTVRRACPQIIQTVHHVKRLNIAAGRVRHCRKSVRSDPVTLLPSRKSARSTEWYWPYLEPLAYIFLHTHSRQRTQHLATRTFRLFHPPYLVLLTMPADVAPLPAGIYCPVITFFDDSAAQALDLKLHEQHCEMLAAAGCHGVVVMGSTGEAVTLSREERKQVSGAERWVVLVTVSPQHRHLLSSVTDFAARPRCQGRCLACRPAQLPWPHHRRHRRRPVHPAGHRVGR